MIPPCANVVQVSVLDRLGGIFHDRQRFWMQGVGSDKGHEETMDAVGDGTRGAVGGCVCERPAGEAHGMRPGSGCATSPGLAAGAAALRGLRRVDAMETNPLSANPERVAVGDGRRA